MEALERGQYEYTKGQVRIVVQGCFIYCASCGALKPASKVGFRTMKNGTIRNQARCGACRKGQEDE